MYIKDKHHVWGTRVGELDLPGSHRSLIRISGAQGWTHTPGLQMGQAVSHTASASRSLQAPSAQKMCKGLCWIFCYCHFSNALSKNNNVGRQDVALQDISEPRVGADGSWRERRPSEHTRCPLSLGKHTPDSYSSPVPSAVSAPKTTGRPSPRLG